VDGISQPAPAPRFSRTAPAVRGGAPAPGADTTSVLADFGFSEAEITSLLQSGAVAGNG
jgi:alpha-methylacyl-CoA racemase